VGLQCSLDRAVHFVGSSDLGIGVIVVVRRNEDHSEVVVAGASEASEASATWQANSIRPLMAQAAPAGIALHSCPDDPAADCGRLGVPIDTDHPELGRTKQEQPLSIDVSQQTQEMPHVVDALAGRVGDEAKVVGIPSAQHQGLLSPECHVAEVVSHNIMEVSRYLRTLPQQGDLGGMALRLSAPSEGIPHQPSSCDSDHPEAEVGPGSLERLVKDAAIDDHGEHQGAEDPSHLLLPSNPHAEDRDEHGQLAQGHPVLRDRDVGQKYHEEDPRTFAGSERAERGCTQAARSSHIAP